METAEEMYRREQMEKIDKYRILNENVIEGQILFTGSSLMEQFPINELLMTDGSDKIVYNRGVGGFLTDDMLKYMEEQIFGVKPSKIFINIGTNDIADISRTFEECLEKMLKNYEKILTQIKERFPDTIVYLMAYYPVNEVDKIPEGEGETTAFINRNNKNIATANKEVEKLAARMGYLYIDVNNGLTDERGMLKYDYTVEGIHMYANAYRVIYHNIKRYL